MNNTTIQLSKGIENMFVVRCKRDKAISNYLVYNLLILMKNILIQLSLIHKKSAERERDHRNYCRPANTQTTCLSNGSRKGHNI